MATVELDWDPFNPLDPGPCMEVVIANSDDVIELGRGLGLEYPAPRPMKALLDTGASLTVISKTYANHCRLFQTNEGSEISALGAIHKCGEHAGSIRFPGTAIQPIDPIRIVSHEFPNQPHYAILIGRDILKHWTITFNGREKRVTIVT